MLIANKTAWGISVLVMSMVALWDMSNRLSNEVTGVQSGFEFDEKLTLDSESFSKAQLDEILKLFDKYDVVAKPVVQNKQIEKPAPKKGLTEAEQLAQGGKLDKFYIGEYTYQLLGLFEDSQKFAVLIQKNINSNVEREVKVVMNQELSPYKVTKITDNYVTFTLPTAQKNIVLSLF